MTFVDYARQWIETYGGRTSKGIRPATRDDYRRRLEQDAIPFFGRTQLAAIEPAHLKQYVAHMAARGIAQNTLRLGVAPVRALLATAVEEGLIRHNPASGLRLFVQQDDEHEQLEEEVKALAEEELARLLSELPADWRLFFEFLAQSGLRIGEAIELRWSDIDLGRRVVHVRRRFYRGRVDRPKSRYGIRRLRVTPEIAQALWRTREAAEDEDLVFTAAGGGRIDQSNLSRRVLKPAAVRAGLGEWVGKPARPESWVGFHSFRHTCATMLFRRGWNAVQVQRFLGHHKASFTIDTYVHLLDEDIPDPTFAPLVAAEEGNEGATQPPETGRDEGLTAVAV